MTEKIKYKKSFTQLKKDLDNKIVLLDGAMGTMIQQQKLSADDFGGEKYEGCNDYLVLTKPEVIKNIHNLAIILPLFVPIVTNLTYSIQIMHSYFFKIYQK